MNKKIWFVVKMKTSKRKMYAYKCFLSDSRSERREEKRNLKRKKSLSAIMPFFTTVVCTKMENTR